MALTLVEETHMIRDIVSLAGLAVPAGWVFRSLTRPFFLGRTSRPYTNIVYTIGILSTHSWHFCGRFLVAQPGLLAYNLGGKCLR